MAVSLQTAVGIDLVPVAEVAAAYAKLGQAYLDRLFTAQEQASCLASDGVPEQRMAARFAAKEATLKILRPTSGLNWLEIEVVKTAGGWCELRLQGQAQALALGAGLAGWAVSLSHEATHAVAVVTACRAAPAAD